MVTHLDTSVRFKAVAAKMMKTELLPFTVINLSGFGSTDTVAEKVGELLEKQSKLEADLDAERAKSKNSPSEVHM
jgi:hypothetical protein